MQAFQITGTIEPTDNLKIMKTRNIDIPQEQIAHFCQRWHITELALFGSVLRDDFRSNSDIDVLVVFAGDVKNTIGTLLDMEDELKEIFGREVDLIERRGIEQSRNYLRRKEILNSAEVIYAAP